MSDASQSLTLVRLQPEMAGLSRWIAATGQRALADDIGYAVHAALQATLGTLAPQPFVLRHRHDAMELLGYSRASSEDIRRALQLPATDPQAAAALDLSTLALSALPTDWRSGERFSFEARVAPVVRSRTTPRGGVVEVDAAWHDSLVEGRPGDRSHAYGRWLARELAREGAAQLLGWRSHSFALTRVARRGQRADHDDGERALARGLLPDLTARGELAVCDGFAFARLLARGLGRHRAFGYGCLLLAPSGVLHRSA